MDLDPASTTFTAALGERYEPAFQAFWDHPALAGLRDGSLPAQCVQHYVAQDYQYLTAFMRCYGLGIALSPDREWVGWFQNNITALADETEPHQALCRAIGVTYESVQARRLAPTAQGYVDHMVVAGHDSLGVLLAALLPCAWTYTWAAARFVEETPPAVDHPFGGWWRFYASAECQELLEEFRSRLDRVAVDAGDFERRRMTEAFEMSCQYEVRFWQMTWTVEDWPVAGAMSI